jgi:hypothetical protein
VKEEVMPAGGASRDATVSAESPTPAAGEQGLAAASSAAVEDGLQAHPTPQDPTVDLTPSKLLITQDEQAFIEVLAPLIPTPRIAKRLINTYRLLRASPTKPDAFERRNGPGQYQAVLLLLAIMNGFPSQAGVLFRELRQSSADTWPKFVDDLRPLPLDHNAPDGPDTPGPNRQSLGPARNRQILWIASERMITRRPW